MADSLFLTRDDGSISPAVEVDSLARAHSILAASKSPSLLKDGLPRRGACRGVTRARRCDGFGTSESGPAGHGGLGRVSR
jgi:hypothetical protein